MELQPKTSRENSLLTVNDPQNCLNYDSEDGILRFSPAEFTRSLLYHILYMMLLGPFACLIIGPIEGMSYLKSTKFFTLDYTLAT